LVRVTVPIPGRSYQVTIGSDVIARAGDHLPDLPEAGQAFVVVDRVVADAWFDRLAEALSGRGMAAVPLTVPAGEDAKTLQVHQTLLHQLATRSAHRSDIVVALGGGATGDLAGFLAATYMRGMPFVQVPTTLTAQVDASVGGKTAVNLPEGKNLVGVFHQPVAVLADVGTLTTLSDRDFRSGLAEVAKYGLTLDPALLADLDDPAPILAREAGAMEELVARCVRVKAAAVAEDERDTGRRLFLNYGHTLGHALERLEGFGGRTHGEAIAAGMVFAARLSERLGRAAPGLSGRTVRLLSSLGLQTGGPLPGAGAITAAFALDKKYRGGVRFVLLEDVGRPVIVDGVPEPTIVEVLEEMGAAA
jgi:3-dehydroquinate synthase